MTSSRSLGRPDAAQLREHEQSIAQLSQLIDLAFDPILAWDWDGGIIQWNRGCEQLYGFSREEALGRISHDLLKTQFPHSRAVTEEGLLSDGTWAGELRHRARDDREVVVDSRMQLVIIDGRKLVLESNRDVTEKRRTEMELKVLRHEAERRLRISEERFRAVQEASPDGFTVLAAVRDESGSIVDFTWVYANEAAAGMVKRPRDWLLGRRVLEIQPGNRQSGIFDRYVRVVETGEPWVSEIDYEYDGLDVFARLAVARVGDGVAISTIDLSERRRAEEALREADRQKDEFLAMLAHELRNPLAPIRNASDLLARILPPEPRAQSVIEVLQRQVAHLSRLVDDLLDVSRITQGRIELKLATVDLAEIIIQAVESVRPSVAERSQDLQVLTHGGSLYVNGDVPRLVQCLVNLLSNAIKYTDRRGRILLESRAEARQAIIEISDNGSGIAPGLLPRIFDLFVQGEQTLDRSQGGLGIGLSLVKRLVEMHGGVVSARSAGLGHGAVFTVRLPLAQPPDGEAEPIAPIKALPRRILVVDDNVDAANTLVMMLRLDDHDVEAVHRGQDALDRIPAFRPEIVLLDIGLPEMDGYQVARQVRKLSGTGRIRLIALTGYGQADDRARAVDAGFDDYLVKPVESSALQARISASGDPSNP